MESNEGLILTSTLWNQSGTIYVSVNGKQTALSGDLYNKYCPFISQTSTQRSVTGCSNTADSQILYYWIEKGYNLNLSASSSDYFISGADEKKYYLSNNPVLGEISLDSLNSLLSGDLTEKLYDGDFIAALNFYCGIKNHSEYASSTSTTWFIRSYYNGTNADVFKAAGFDSYFFIPENCSDLASTRIFTNSNLNETGFSILRENLDYGEIIRVGIPGHAIYMDGYRYNSATGEYEYHLNYGWGISTSATKWYTVSELEGKKLTYVTIDLSPDIKVNVTNASSEYYGGSFLRGVERINHIQNKKRTTFSFADDLAGKNISLSSSVNFTSQVDIDFLNFCTDLQIAATAGIYSTMELAFEFKSGSVAVTGSSADKAAIQAGKLDVELDNSWLYAGSWSNLTGIANTIVNGSIFDLNDFSQSFLASVSGKSLVGSNSNDTVNLINNSAVFGSIDLGGGNNTITVDNGSLIYGALSGSTSSLDLNLVINDMINYGAMIVADTSFMENSLLAVTGGVINVLFDLNKITGAYVLVDGFSASVMDDFTIQLSMGDEYFKLNSANSAAGNFKLVSQNGDLVIDHRESNPVEFYSNGTLMSAYDQFTGTIGKEYNVRVSSNGQVQNSLISGGQLRLFSGGSSLINTLRNNGQLYISSGGVAGNTIVDGGKIFICNGGMHQGSLQITADSTVYAETGAIIDFTVASRSVTDEYLINDLSLISGTPDYTITVAVNQSYGEYKLAQGAKNFTGAVTISNGTADYGTLTVNGSALTYNNAEYMLKNTSGNLTLMVGDFTVPELVITRNTKNLTNEDVILQISASDGASGIKSVLYSFDLINWFAAEKTLTVTENRNVYFKVTDNAGHVTEKTESITNIDKVAPDKPVLYVSTYDIAKSVTVMAEFSDDSVVRQYKIGNGQWRNFTRSFIINENATVYFRAEDAAGNESTGEIIINNIDNIAPDQPVATANITGLTREDVIITAVFSDDSVVRQYKIGNGKWMDYTEPFTVEENTTVYLRAQDAAGNESNSTLVIDNIDKTAPDKPEAKLNILSPAQSVTVTAVFSSDSTVRQYKTGDGKWMDYTEPFTVEENTTVYLRAQDAAGNESNSKIVINNIDRTAPDAPEGIADTTTLTNKDVTVTAVFSSDSTVRQYKIGNGQWQNYINAFAVADNATVYFRAKDAAGNESNSELIIDCIDKTAPTLEITGLPTQWSKLAILHAVTDDESAVIEYYNGSQWVPFKELTVTQNGTYQFRVSDKAGNVTERTIDIDRIITTLNGVRISSDTDIKAGTVVENAIVTSGGNMRLFDGGLANCTILSGGTMSISSGGTANDTSIDNNGKMLISSGGNANNINIGNDGTLLISSGGNANRASVNYQGSMYVSSGGKAVEIMENGGFVSIGEGANVTFVSNTINGLTMSRGEMTIHANTIAKNTIVNSRAAMHIYSSGVAENSVVSCGTMNIYDGGTANNTVARGEWWYAGNMNVFSGGTANNTTVNSLFTMTVAGGGVASNTILRDGTLHIYGTHTGVLSATAGSVISAYEGSVIDFSVAQRDAGASYLINDMNLIKGICDYTITVAADQASGTYKLAQNANLFNGTITIGDGMENYGELTVNGPALSRNGTDYILTAKSGKLTLTVGDFVPPEAPEVTADISLPTCSTVTVFAVFSADSTKQQYSLNNKKWFDYTTGVEMNNNGTVYFRGIDQSGNISDVTAYQVANIDKLPPMVRGNVDRMGDSCVISLVCDEKASYKLRYSADGRSFIEYPGIISGDTVTLDAVEDMKYFQIQATDEAGNISGWKDLLPIPQADTESEIIFVSSKYTDAGKVNGKKQNGITLTYGINAFDSIEKTGDTTGKTVIMLDNQETDYTGKHVVAGAAVIATDKKAADSYSSKINSIPKGTLTLSAGQNAENTDFIRFATVNISNAAVSDIAGGKESSGEEAKNTSDKKGTVTDTGKSTFSANVSGKLTAYNASAGIVKGYSTVNLTGAATINELYGGNRKNSISTKTADGKTTDQKTISAVNDLSAAGSVTLKDGSFAGKIDGFSNVTISDAAAGNITNFTSKDSKSETAAYDEAKNSVTRKVTLSHTETASGTLKATNAVLSDVTGFATVTLKNVSYSGDFRRESADGGKYSTVKETLAVKTDKNGVVTGTYSKTETFTRAGKFTATDSKVGDIENFSTVTLDGSSAGAVSNFATARIVTKGTASWENAVDYGRPENYDIDLTSWDLAVTETGSLNGSVTLKNGASADSVTNFRSVTLTAGEVTGAITNVNKVSASKGSNIIGSYTGSDGNDTLSIAKGAVLTAGEIVLTGAKDTLALNGTLVMTGSRLEAAKITGKGEIAAAGSTYDEIVSAVNFANILKLHGDISDNFRGSAYEQADNDWKKAVKWDTAEEYDGWLGSWSGYTDGCDAIDHIKFYAAADDTIDIQGIGAENWVLLDKKGNIIDDESIFADGRFMVGGNYIIKVNVDDTEKSLAYTIKLA